MSRLRASLETSNIQLELWIFLEDQPLHPWAVMEEVQSKREALLFFPLWNQRAHSASVFRNWKSSLCFNRSTFQAFTVVVSLFVSAFTNFSGCSVLCTEAPRSLAWVPYIAEALFHLQCTVVLCRKPGACFIKSSEEKWKWKWRDEKFVEVTHCDNCMRRWKILNTLAKKRAQICLT